MWLPKPRSVMSYRLAIMALYGQVEHDYGEEVARNMFAPYGRELTPREVTRRKNLALVLAFLDMPKPNKQKLAKKLAKENETLPRAECHGPRGSTDAAVMLKQISRVLNEKEYRVWAEAEISSR
jgi:hypothetical protein